MEGSGGERKRGPLEADRPVRSMAPSLRWPISDPGTLTPGPSQK